MKIFAFILFLLGTSLFLTGCDKKSSDNLSCETVTLNKPFVAELGDLKCLLPSEPNQTWTIKFGPMLEDSRCNEGNDCIWAGRFVMETTILIGDAITVDTFDARALSDEIWSDTLRHHGYEIILAKVNPGTRLQGPVDPSEYTFDMLIRE